MQIYSKNNKNCFFSLISWPIWFWFALSGRAKFGTINFSFIFQPILIWFALYHRANFGTLCPFPGIKFLFFDQFKSVPHKIYDICCCETPMSVTSLTFWLSILFAICFYNCYFRFVFHIFLMIYILQAGKERWYLWMYPLIFRVATVRT